MKTKLLLSIACFAGLVGISQGATINLTRGIGNPGVGLGPAYADGGYAIAVGSYASDPTPLIGSMDLVNLFQLFAAGTSPTSGATKGLITGSFTSTANGAGQAPSMFNNQLIYVMVGDKPTMAASSAFGIFAFQTVYNFPPDVTATGATSVTLSNATVMKPILGEVSGGNFVLVPEPTTALLSSLGILALLRRRR